VLIIGGADCWLLIFISADYLLIVSVLIVGSVDC
jgi:hypothetical protein